MKDKHFCILSLGSNLGDREQNLKDAIALIKAAEDISDVCVASLYVTEPVGFKDQADFYNTCVSLYTTKTPEELLAFTSGIENELGRKRVMRWGPRTLDIDIITIDDLKLRTPKLTVPHPRYKERAFVLYPMSELTGLDCSLPEDQAVRKEEWTL
ncbi:MAG: 2-amino-4-hydroxy-6-hydroxymethyldihydropteridine diphosphokinase [Clostridiales bacterium]|nr:2-amino-4-hydroxy-6-hydroxymethyldihydropteridine diphosphokinase [Clostridiales bacterium]